MPIYEYECSEGHVTEDFQAKMNPKRRIRCHCKKMARKIISRSNFNNGLGIYWPKDSQSVQGGRVIENLGHKPVYVDSKDKYREILKRTRTSEAG